MSARLGLYTTPSLLMLFTCRSLYKKCRQFQPRHQYKKCRQFQPRHQCRRKTICPKKIDSSFLCCHGFHCIELLPLTEYCLYKRATKSTTMRNLSLENKNCTYPCFNFLNRYFCQTVNHCVNSYIPCNFFVLSSATTLNSLKASRIFNARRY